MAINDTLKKPSVNQPITFSDPDALDWLEAQTNEQLNDASFGVVRMSLDGRVVRTAGIPNGPGFGMWGLASNLTS